MATYEDALKEFTQEMDSMGIHYHLDLYHKVAKHLGPSIHQHDASLVACTDDAERQRIKTNFLMGTLGLEDSPELDKAIEQVCGHLGEPNTNKHRATFYYLLVGILHKEQYFLGLDWAEEKA